MASDQRQPIKHDNILGMDRSTDPYQLVDKGWFTQFGFRISQQKSLEQVPRKKVLQTLVAGVGNLLTEDGDTLTDESGNILTQDGQTAAPISAIVSIPIDNTYFYNHFIFCSGVYLALTQTTASQLYLIDSSTTVPSRLSFEDLTVNQGDRWATTIYENRIYFTNPSTPIHVVTSQPYVSRLNQAALSTTYNAPAARYIETFYDHLFVADVNYKGIYPNRIQWSDLYKFDVWDSTRSNEADHYDINDSEQAVVGGLTGLKKLGNELFVYSSTAIYSVNYIGLPTVFRTDVRIPDVGNDFKYGLVALERTHVFPSIRWRIFFMFNGEQVTPFGEEIAEFFFNDLNSDFTLQQKTFGYVDTTSNELVWSYISSISSGLYDKELVWNIKTKKWYVRACEDVNSFLQGSRTVKPISGLTGNISSLTNTINALGTQTDTLKKLWGDSTTRILTEGIPSDSLLEQTLPYLETNDFTFNDFDTTKEVETLVLNAVLGNSPGIEVYISTRTLINDAVTFVKVNQDWTPTLKEGRLSLPRTSGRIFRYRFQPKPKSGGVSVDNVAWTNFIQFVYGLKAEK